MHTGHRSSAVPLALAFTALVLYASLYPFAGWRWPAGHRLPELLLLPWPPWQTPLDDAFNYFGYLPLGLLICIAVLRSGGRISTALAVAMFGASALSYATEVTQHFLPSRHPSLKDWAMNSLGAGSGAALATLLHLGGWLQRWERVRERWFAGHSAGALALLALWPLGLLFPTPVPWGLGAVGNRFREAVLGVLEDVSWAEPLAHALAAPAAPPARALLVERLASMLGLLAPVLLAYAVTRPGLRRLVLAGGALALGLGAMTLSTLLNFGPAHALAWTTPTAAIATAGAAALALLLAPLPARLVQGLALVALTALVALVPQSGGDPYFAQNLQDWEQGRFVHFHGLTQWLGLLWPYAAIVWLLMGLGRQPRD